MSNGRSRALGRSAVAVVALLAGVAIPDGRAADPVSVATFRVVGDAIPDALATTAGDAARGRTLFLARESANCVLCHAIPEPAARFAGDVGPSLAGIGSRLSAPQLRLRVADNLRVNPSSVMPSYYRWSGFERVAPRYAGKPILTATEVEDVVAYLVTLR